VAKKKSKKKNVMEEAGKLIASEITYQLSDIVNVDSITEAINEAVYDATIEMVNDSDICDILENHVQKVFKEMKIDRAYIRKIVKQEIRAMAKDIIS